MFNMSISNNNKEWVQWYILKHSKVLFCSFKCIKNLHPYATEKKNHPHFRMQTNWTKDATLISGQCAHLKG